MEKWMVAAKKADFEKWARDLGIAPVVARIIRNREITEEELRCACRYAGRFPVDFSALFFVNLCEFKNIRRKLLSIQEFEAWRRNNPGYME